MIDKLSFLKNDLLWPVIVIGMIVWLLFLWKDVKQVKGMKLTLRAMVSFCAVLSLGAMVLELQIESDQKLGSGVVLTKNYNQRQLDSLKKIYPNLLEIPYKNEGLQQAQLDSIDAFYIIGNGLMPYDLWQLEGKNIQYIGGNEIQGITKLKYDQNVTLGDSISIIGSYFKSPQTSKIVLQDAAGNGIDSLLLPASSRNQLFELGALPKSVGNFIYKIVEKDSLGNTQSSNPLPIQIAKKEGLRILVMNTYPTFETKYLKNYLAKNGHEILLRTQLTKGIYKFESFNRAQSSIYNLTSSNLADFDLVIIDVSSLKQLASSSKNALMTSLEEGLGIFIQPDISMVQDIEDYGFRFKRNNLKSTALPQFSSFKIPRIPYSIVKTPLNHALLQTKDEDLTIYSQWGNGRVATSLLTDTYQLLLNGNEKAYAFIWSATFTALSKKLDSSTAWSSDQFIGYIDEPFHFGLRSTIANPIVVDKENYQIGLKQDIHFKDKWLSKVYPTKVGWNDMSIKQDSTNRFLYYVAASGAWEDMRSYLAKCENVRYFNNPLRRDNLLSNKHLVSKWWFFVIFLIAMACLWALPKWDH